MAGERNAPDGRVAEAVDITEERLMTCGRVAAAGGVAKKGERSNGRVGVTGRVAEKRASACSRVLACGITKECPSADTRAEAPVGQAQQRVCPDSRVIQAGGEAPKGEIPLRQVGSRTALIGRVTGCARLRGKRKARDYQQGKK